MLTSSEQLANEPSPPQLEPAGDEDISEQQRMRSSFGDQLRSSFGDQLLEARPSVAERKDEVAEQQDEVAALARKDTAGANMIDGIRRPGAWVPVGHRYPFRVIRHAHELTPEWLTKALQFRGLLPPWAKVATMTWKPLGEGLGVMGDIVRVRVTYEGEGAEQLPTGFIGKFSPQGRAPLPSFVIRSIFSTEAHWYNDFLEEDGGLARPISYITAAKLFHQRWWRRMPVFCMMLEELPPPIYSRVSGCKNVQHLRLIMDAMARFHSKWWKHPKSRPLEWATHPTKDMGGWIVNGFILTTKLGLKALAKCYGPEWAPVLEWLPHVRRRHKYILQRLFAPPLTLCHGDVHLDNIFFHESFGHHDLPKGVKMIDFGNMMFSQAMFDVSFFMGTNLDVAVRREHEEALLRHYHQRLVEHGVADYSFEQAWLDYRFNLWRPSINLLAVVRSFASDKRRKRGMFADQPTKTDKALRDMYEKFNERLVAALVDHKWLDLLLEGDATCGPCGCMPCCA